ncbi:MAG: hypothetical protein WDN03_08795 [Rhizomicrobium sp.]
MFAEGGQNAFNTDTTASTWGNLDFYKGLGENALQSSIDSLSLVAGGAPNSLAGLTGYDLGNVFGTPANNIESAGRFTFGAASFAAGGLAAGAERAGLFAAEVLAPAENSFFVIGRQTDTAVANDWIGHSVFDTPDWTLSKNDAFIQNIINGRGTVYVASPESQENLWSSVENRPSIFARELGQLRAGGYQNIGGLHVPSHDTLSAMNTTLFASADWLRSQNNEGFGPLRFLS